jgi:hypothetical protein
VGDPDRREHVYAEAQHRLVCREIGRADARFRGACVVDENVEPPVLTLNSFGGCRDTWVARGVDLEEGSPEFAGRSPPALCITCPDEHSVPDL